MQTGVLYNILHCNILHENARTTRLLHRRYVSSHFRVPRTTVTVYNKVTEMLCTYTELCTASLVMELKGRYVGRR